jgi:uncharacterized protein YcaQ
VQGDTVSLDEARRIALAAQGFDRLRPSGRVTETQIARVIRRLGLIQIDYVNVLIPAHYQVPFSRLGPYKTSLLDKLASGGRDFTEQWAHEASIVPVDTWPLLRHRMETHRVRPYPFAKFMAEQPAYVTWVLEEVRARGPLSADDLPDFDGVARKMPSWSWIGTVPRATLEALFGRGVLAVAARRTDFSRVFDLAERLIPAEHHARSVPREEAERALLLSAARAHGLGTAADLADYYRMPIRGARPRLDELVQSAALRRVEVEGWREPGFLHPEARLPREINASALLSPFDPLIWFRKRALRLFAFDYRIEIFVPKPKRRWGYYVLPFLLGDRLVARVDLKADRAARRLLVLAAHLEPGAPPAAVAAALVKELRTMAKWLGLGTVHVQATGGFAARLAQEERR